MLLHPTSLPGPHGSGDLGPAAYRFIDFLSAAGQRWWQMLPVGPPGFGQSPYSSESALAGNPLLISLDLLAEEGLIPAGARVPLAPLGADRVEFGPMVSHRIDLLRVAFENFEQRQTKDDFIAYCAANAAWLDDFSLFRALKRAHGGGPWTTWQPWLRRREAPAIAGARADLGHEVRFESFLQFVFSRQWQALRAYAAARGVGLLGDLPIFVAHDSVDVWCHPEDFFLDEEGQPTAVSGVPPDYFSADGQRWGNPLYRWKRMKRAGYPWWIARLTMELARFDAIRLDHFIGFQRYWRIPADQPTARGGKWIKGPGSALFDALRRALGDTPFIAEDLGAISPAVVRLRKQVRLPGLKVLQFAFGDDPSAADFLPHHYARRCVVYTGTHDNDTVVGWFRDEGGPSSTRTPTQIEQERGRALAYLGTSGKEIHWDLIRLAQASVAGLCIFPLQDLLGLGTEARLNLPGRAEGNWSWRFQEGVLTSELARRLRELTLRYGRTPKEVA